VKLLQARALVALLGLASIAGGCSRPGNDAPHADGSAISRPAPPLTASAAEGPAGVLSAGPVLTPEDVEPETEQRITEQNLESELDRLEREIQAE
jgi:hypothetical protein